MLCFFFVKQVMNLWFHHSFDICRDFYLFKINKESKEEKEHLNICKAYNIPIIRSTTMEKKTRVDKTINNKIEISM